MRFGIRQVANLTMRSKQEVVIGSQTFHAGQPVLYIDTATTSSLEQAATTVYATGGRGNTRLIAWEGDKTLTLTFTDALLSPIGLSILSGADLFHASGYGEGIEKVHVHQNGIVSIGANGKIDISDALAEYGKDETTNQYIAKVCVDDAPVFVMALDDDGASVTGEVLATDAQITVTETAGTAEKDPKTELTVDGIDQAQTVMLDYYIDLPTARVWEADIRPDTFAGYYYVEADVLVRDQATGKDMQGALTIPNAKLQSNFTITMASTGDPSTFDFTLDAFPGYTYFDKTKKVLCVVQIVDNTVAGAKRGRPVMPHTDEIEHGATDDKNIASAFLNMGKDSSKTNNTSAARKDTTGTP